MQRPLLGCCLRLTSIATAVISDTTAPERDLKRSGYLMLRFVWVRLDLLLATSQSLPTFPGVSSLGMSFFAGAGARLSQLVLPGCYCQKHYCGGLRLSWQMFGFKSPSVGRHPKLGRAFL